MPYWIHDNGETIGPMPAIDVLRRATPTTRVCDGEIWVTLHDDDGEGFSPDAPTQPNERLIIRSAAS